MPRAGSDVELILQYTASGPLPDGPPVEEILSYDLLSHSVVSDNDIVCLESESLFEARRQFTKLVYHRLHRTIITVPIDPDLLLET